MPIVKSTSASESTTNEALDCLHELSQLLNTGLDKKNFNSIRLKQLKTVSFFFLFIV
jgi:hypothetical protein